MLLVGAITSIHSFEKGKFTMKRLRHLAFAAQRGGEQIRAEEQQARPIYDALAKALRLWDILGLAKYDDLAYGYEDVVIWLIKNLEPMANHNDVEQLLLQAFSDQKDFSQLDSDDALRLQALAADILKSWSQYRQRHAPSALTQQTHTRSRMRRFVLPR